MHNSKLIFLRNILMSICVILFSFFKSNAQQDPQFTQYMYNTMVVNPAYAGTVGQPILTLAGKTQWLGVKDAPNTQNISFHTTLSDMQNLGLGVNLMNDVIGPIHEIYADFNISYAITLKNESKLSFGLKLGARNFNVDVTKYIPTNPNEIDMQTNINKILPTIGAGLYYYSEKYYMGVSVPNFIPSDVYSGSKNSGSIAKERYHIYTMAGYVLSISDNVRFKPATLLKIVKGAPISFDISANFLLNEKFHAGLSYRVTDSIGALLGFQVNNNIFIGYAYDLTTTNYRVVNNGSHEIILRYQGNKRPSKLKCDGGGLILF